MTYDAGLIDQFRQKSFDDLQLLHAPSSEAVPIAPVLVAPRDPMPGIKMIIGDWSVDTFGNRCREIWACD
jgi:hypothetical protein